MHWAWIVGGLHGLAGSAILFGSLHPLRDILTPDALALAQLGSGLEISQGIALLVLARAQTLIAAALIAAGTTLWSAMLYFIVFTGQHPLDAVIPAGGAIMLMGWIVLVFSVPKAAT